MKKLGKEDMEPLFERVSIIANESNCMEGKSGSLILANDGTEIANGFNYCLVKGTSICSREYCHNPKNCVRADENAILRLFNEIPRTEMVKSILIFADFDENDKIIPFGRIRDHFFSVKYAMLIGVDKWIIKHKMDVYDDDDDAFYMYSTNELFKIYNNIVD
jgi:hypothetical protein